jgi:hypothetical protein
MIRKIYFYLQPVPVLGKLARLLNLILRKSLIQWLRKKNSQVEIKANQILLEVEATKMKDKFQQRAIKMNFPEGE